ncbi:SPOR domain-containing protein [Tatumella terrea]|uniref:SPOR domain-containing protein n=1 Tax=Tatumella terrea TaxID=419007 RepID=A0ABW1VSG9_9GAMM
MDEFQPEDELKPDASDRPAARTRKSSPKPKLPKLPQLPQLPVSKQHIMIAVGILVLLLLILGIGAALKGPSQSPVAGNSSSAGGEGKSIDLSGSSVMSNTPGTASDAPPPPVAGSDTEGNPASPSDMSSASSSASSAPGVQSQPDAAQKDVSTDGTATPVASQTTLPTAPATLGLNVKNNGMVPGNRSANTSPSVPSVPHSAVRKSPASERNVAAERREREARITEQRRREEQRRVTEQRRVAEQRRAAEPRRVAEHPVKETRKPVTASEPVMHESKPASVARKTPPEAIAQVPSGEYTIQLSGATHRESLNAWARQQNLTGYHVYETQRNGQPWYVLVSGSYATSAEAKRAISTLPEAVRAKSPWVKPLSQVRKEAAK